MHQIEPLIAGNLFQNFLMSKPAQQTQSQSTIIMLMSFKMGIAYISNGLLR